MRQPRYFKWIEFECPCCHNNDIDINFVYKLDELRDNIQFPLYINSGYRCPSHNSAVDGVNGSMHLVGKAADIKIKHLSNKDKWYLVQMAYIMGFHGICVDTTFVHLDVGTRYWIGD